MVLALGLGLSAYADFGEILYPKPEVELCELCGRRVDTSEMNANVLLYDSNKYVTINVTLQKYSSGWKDTNTTTSGEGYYVASASTPVSLFFRALPGKNRVPGVHTTKGGAYMEGDTLYSSECLV